MRFLLMIVAFILAGPVFGQDKPMKLPADRINEAARKAQQDNSDESLKALSAAAVHVHGLPSILNTQFQEALVQAEKRYRAGGPGVTETELAELHNALADSLNLPQHSRVDQKQLRALRMELMIREPALMGTGLHDPATETETEINPVMSPLQAARLESMMILQKQVNPSFQFHPSEWSLEKGQAARAELDHAENQTINQKAGELDLAITKGVSDLSLSEGLQVLKRVRKTFKLDQERQ